MIILLQGKRSYGQEITDRQMNIVELFKSSNFYNKRKKGQEARNLLVIHHAIPRKLRVLFFYSEFLQAKRETVILVRLCLSA